MTDPLGEFRDIAVWDFNELADYLWKSPSFIEAQRMREGMVGKKPTQRPHPLRWALEVRKLYLVFPSILAGANLFATVSLFELKILDLARLLVRGGRLTQPEGPIDGLARTLRHFYDAGIRGANSEPAAQAMAAIKIRNAVAHAGGILDRSRNAEELRRIVATRSFLIDRHRGAKHDPADPNSPNVAVMDTPIGRQLVITNGYPWILSGYLRDFLVELCEAAA
jgi:hypothetical protein